MNREARVQAVVEAAERMVGKYLDADGTRWMPEFNEMLAAVRALHQPEPKWRAEPFNDYAIIGQGRAERVVCGSTAVRDRVLRLLLADEAKEGA